MEKIGLEKKIFRIMHREGIFKKNIIRDNSLLFIINKQTRNTYF